MNRRGRNIFMLCGHRPLGGGGKKWDGPGGHVLSPTGESSRAGSSRGVRGPQHQSDFEGENPESVRNPTCNR